MSNLEISTPLAHTPTPTRQYPQKDPRPRGDFENTRCAKFVESPFRVTEQNAALHGGIFSRLQTVQITSSKTMFLD